MSKYKSLYLLVEQFITKPGGKRKKKNSAHLRNFINIYENVVVVNLQVIS